MQMQNDALEWQYALMPLNDRGRICSFYFSEKEQARHKLLSFGRWLDLYKLVDESFPEYKRQLLYLWNITLVQFLSWMDY